MIIVENAGVPPNRRGWRIGIRPAPLLMTELFGPIANVVLPIALCVAVGGALAVLKLPFDRKIIGGVVTYVGYPALIISHLSAGHVALSSFAVMAGAALAALAVFVAASSLFLRLLGLPVRAFIAPMSLNNGSRSCWRRAIGSSTGMELSHRLT